LARNFRWYEKKRGNRRTGSSRLGRAGELLFFAALFLLGCGGLVAIFTFFVIPEWRVNHDFIEHTCTVENTCLAENGGLYRAEIEIKYVIDGVEYVRPTYDIATVMEAGSSYSSDKEGKQAIRNSFTRHKQYPCWYDPENPSRVVLVRGYSWWVWLSLIVPVSFLLIGGGGLIYAVLHWGKSAERSAVIAQRAQGRELFNGNGRSGPKFPTIPDGADITNSPGTKLKFRLPIGTSPGWALLGTLLLCVFWNGIVSVFAVLAVGSYLSGHPDWLLMAFVVPFVVAGIALMVLFVRQMLVTTGIGPTLVEISDHPLVPGAQYRLFLSQAGRLKINTLAVALVCEEQATYRQGTDARTETRQVYEQELFRREGFQVRHGLPFEGECEFAVPTGIMHSFKAAHNQVNWKVVVKGDAAGWPDFKRTFSVIVHPSNGSTGP
jgi:hypothetical protein